MMPLLLLDQKVGPKYSLLLFVVGNLEQITHELGRQWNINIRVPSSAITMLFYETIELLAFDWA
jgi:hypothetical protein